MTEDDVSFDPSVLEQSVLERIADFVRSHQDFQLLYLGGVSIFLSQPQADSVPSATSSPVAIVNGRSLSTHSYIANLSSPEVRELATLRVPEDNAVHIDQFYAGHPRFDRCHFLVPSLCHPRGCSSDISWPWYERIAFLIVGNHAGGLIHAWERFAMRLGVPRAFQKKGTESPASPAARTRLASDDRLHSLPILKREVVYFLFGVGYRLIAPGHRVLRVARRA